MRRTTIHNLIFSSIVLLISMNSYSQPKDELLSPANNFKTDSIAAFNLVNKIDSLYDQGEFTKALKLIEQAIPFCEKIGITSCLARVFVTKGDIFRSTDNYIKALELFSISLEQYQKINDNKGIANIKNRIGAIYRLQGNYPSALEHYFEALSIYQSESFKYGISNTLNNIGVVYLYQNNYDKALEYYLKCLTIEKELNNEKDIGSSYFNIGKAYKAKADYKNAIDFLLKSLVLSKKQNDLYINGVNYNEIGSIYTELNNLQQAKYYLDLALLTFKELGTKSRQAECNIYLGQYFIKKNNPAQAIIHNQNALSLSKEIGSKEIYTKALLKQSEIYQSINNSTLALRYYKEFITIRDSLFSQDNTKRMVQAELLYQFERKQDVLKVMQEKRDELFLVKTKNQKIVRNFLIALITLLVILIAFGFSAYSTKLKANTILTNQQNEILEKNEELLQQQEEIITQRDEIEQKNQILERSQQIIEAKNERIISSIEYAQTIQQAILPHENQLSKFFKDHFVIFLPKDIVSGDFFWFSADQDTVFAAVIDCTGHGVPGSFMSLIGNTLLNQIVNEWHTHDPALILEYLNIKIRKALQQDENQGKSHASMDVCLMKINLIQQRLVFAGANRSLLIIQDGKLEKISGDIKSVGGYQRESNRYYTNHEINLTNNSYIYLTTDGFIDQMNSEKRKLGQRKFSELLLAHHHEPMSVQKEKLLNMLDNYRNGEEQIDDICILGIKI